MLNSRHAPSHYGQARTRTGPNQTGGSNTPSALSIFDPTPGTQPASAAGHWANTRARQPGLTRRGNERLCDQRNVFFL